MLDCHIIVSADTRRDWVTQCLDSVREAADRAGYPVAVHLVDGVPGHIGMARAAGYAMGSHPYVTCVDDDDYLMPHAFAQLLYPMRDGVPAICTPEVTEQNGQRRFGLAQHHLIAYRREVLIDHTPWPCCGDVAQLAAVPIRHTLDRPAYVHRLYGDSKARVMRRANPNELERARA